MRAQAFLVMVVVGLFLGCGGDDDGSGGGGAGAGGGAMMCPNGVREGTEQCDGNDLGTSTCMSLGRGMGVLSCNPTTCIFNTTMCGTTTSVGGGGG